MVGAWRGLIAVALALMPMAAAAEGPVQAEMPLARPGSVAPVQTPMVIAATPAAPTVLQARPRPRPVPGQPIIPVNSLAKEIDARRGDVAVAAILMDVESGDVLERAGVETLMPAASVTKLVTTLYGIDQLGRQYRFRTIVYGTGPIVDGVLEGDLILKGGGDPALDSDELAGLADQLSALGIRTIRGRFLYDASALPLRPALVSVQPPHVAYNPGLGGLNLNFNRVFLEWEAGGESVALTARAARYRPVAKGIRADLVPTAPRIFSYVQSPDAGEVWTVAQDALRRKGGRWLPVRDPAPYAANAFRDIARSKDIYLPRPLPGLVPEDAEPLAQYARRPLDLVTRGMLHFSTNLTAETIGLTASGAATLPASAEAMSRWAVARYGIDGVSFADHSGLNDQTKISAEAMAKLLVAEGRLGTLDGLVRRYGVTDRTGKRPAGKNVDVRAKTGTLNFVRGLAGYIIAPTGKRLAFAIFQNDAAERLAANHLLESPPGGRRFSNRAVGMEQMVLRRWINAYAR